MWSVIEASALSRLLLPGKSSLAIEVLATSESEPKLDFVDGGGCRDVFCGTALLFAEPDKTSARIFVHASFPSVTSSCVISC